MSEQTVLYTRTMTGIEGLQPDCYITYAITQTSQGYGICVVESSSAMEQTESIDFVCPSKQQAESFLLFLYENSVYPAQIKDIFSDIKSNGFFMRSKGE